MQQEAQRLRQTLHRLCRAALLGVVLMLTAPTVADAADPGQDASFGSPRVQRPGASTDYSAHPVAPCVSASPTQLTTPAIWCMNGSSLPNLGGAAIQGQMLADLEGTTAAGITAAAVLGPHNHGGQVWGMNIQAESEPGSGSKLGAGVHGLEIDLSDLAGVMGGHGLWITGDSTSVPNHDAIFIDAAGLPGYSANNFYWGLICQNGVINACLQVSDSSGAALDDVGRHHWGVLLEGTYSQYPILVRAAGKPAFSVDSAGAETASRVSVGGHAAPGELTDADSLVMLTATSATSSPHWSVNGGGGGFEGGWSAVEGSYLRETDGKPILFTDEHRRIIASFAPDRGLATTSVTETAPVVPRSSHAPCRAGQHAWDQQYEYRCVATNSWKRAALSGW